MLDLHEATLDYRWLQWLEQSKKPEAGALAKELRTLIASNWQQASEITTEQLLDVRRKIMKLAEE